MPGTIIISLHGFSHNTILQEILLLSVPPFEAMSWAG